MPQTPPFKGQLNSGGYNNNVYQSSEEAYHDLYFQDHSLVSGSLEALIHHLVPTVDYYPDVSSSDSSIKVTPVSLGPSLVCNSNSFPHLSVQRTYIFTFLLSSRLFIHPHQVMSKVCQLCVEQQRLGEPPADKVP